jgi:hypothetical protein
VDHSADEDMLEIQTLTAKARQDQEIDARSKIFVAIAWTTRDKQRLFKLFPEVLHCDATCDTRN